MIIIARADLSIYQRINVCAKNLENKNPAGVIVVFTANTRSDILKLKVFEGELGRENYLTELYIDTQEFGAPSKGELMAFKGNKEDDDYTVWQIINVFHDYTVDEINIFVKRYIWPDER